MWVLQAQDHIKRVFDSMSRLFSKARCFLKSECGATSVEYGLLIGLLSIVVIGTVVSLASYVNGVFEQAHTEIANGGITAK